MLWGLGCPGGGIGVMSFTPEIAIEPEGPTRVTSTAVNEDGSTVPANVTVTDCSFPLTNGSGVTVVTRGPATGLNGLLLGKRIAKSPRPKVVAISRFGPPA